MATNTTYSCDRCGSSSTEYGKINYLAISSMSGPNGGVYLGDLCDGCLASLRTWMKTFLKAEL